LPCRIDINRLAVTSIPFLNAANESGKKWHTGPIGLIINRVPIAVYTESDSGRWWQTIRWAVRRTG